MKKVRVGKSGIKGKGLFAEEPIKRGELVLRMSGKAVREAALDRMIAQGKLRNDDPYEIAAGKYRVLDPIPLAINHSCAPNLGIRGTDRLIALRNIKAGEELTYDYSTVVGLSGPSERDWSLRCRCGAPHCRTRIGNWQTLPRPRLNFYIKRDVLPTFIRKQVTSRGSSRK